MEHLNVHSISNIRDLGGYDAPHGPTLSHRFIRCGSTSYATKHDLARLFEWGVTRVLDLRGQAEAPNFTCRFARLPNVVWENVSLFDVDISSPAMIPVNDTNNYLVSSYLQMLASAKAVRRIFEFFAEARPEECVLFHCAAGMDRTGMVAMLLLGLAGVGREQVIADYAYSFAAPKEVTIELTHANSKLSFLRRKFTGKPSRQILQMRIDTIATVYDTLVQTHGSTEAFLLSCGISKDVVDTVRGHLLAQ